MSLRELANRITGHLARGTSPVDCSTMTDAELRALCGPELTEEETRILAVVRQTLLHDAAEFAAELLEMEPGLDQELLRGILRYWTGASRDDRDLAAACAIAENVLTRGTA